MNTSEHTQKLLKTNRVNRNLVGFVTSSVMELTTFLRTSFLVAVNSIQHLHADYARALQSEAGFFPAPTLIDVLLSNLNDLVCPFSKYTFRTFGIKSSELSFIVS